MQAAPRMKHLQTGVNSTASRHAPFIILLLMVIIMSQSF